MVVEGDDLVGGNEEVKFAEFGLKFFVAAGFPGLALQGTDLAMEFADYIVEAEQVGVCLLQFPHRLLAVGAETSNAAGFLEDGASIFGAGRQDGVDLSLGHDGIRRGPDACAHEKTLDIAEAARGFIDVVVALASPENAAGHGDFVIVCPQLLFAIGKGDGDLGHTEGLVVIRTIENHIRHGGTAQGGGALFA